MTTKVGVIGAGRMGFPMVRNLRGNGFEVYAYDVDKDAQEKAVNAGSQSMKNPKKLGQQ